MHTITFYPVGNGDTSQIELENGKRILLDFRHLTKSEDENAPELDLAAELRADLEGADRDYFDVVAFTHADDDHIHNSTQFFELQHAQKYQGDDRVKINELWVPAAMILESCEPDERTEEFVVWRAEARHRLKNGSGIRVFSKPDKLEGWLVENGLTLADRQHMITDAGQIAPGFSLEHDGIEFFCHSPFIKHVDDAEEFRNAAALVFNIRMSLEGSSYDFLAVGDSEWEILEDIVSVTKAHGNQDRLGWDLFNIPHHCSYLALSDDKGETETMPKPGVAELLLSGREGAHIVCSSLPIDDTLAARAQRQPPHVQAKNCYQTHLDQIDGGRFYVTMEEPNRHAPKPVSFEVSKTGITKVRSTLSGAAAVVAARPPRAG